MTFSFVFLFWQRKLFDLFYVSTLLKLLGYNNSYTENPITHFLATLTQQREKFLPIVGTTSYLVFKNINYK